MSENSIKTEFAGVVSSGKEHTAFGTGSQRDNRVGKGRQDLLPFLILGRDARHYENGAVKYTGRNWELGQPSSVYFASAFRHLEKYILGDREEDHLAAARWNIAGLMFNEEMVRRGIYDPALLDLPDYTNLETFTRTVIEPVRRETEERKRAKEAEACRDKK